MLVKNQGTSSTIPLPLSPVEQPPALNPREVNGIPLGLQRKNTSRYHSGPFHTDYSAIWGPAIRGWEANNDRSWHTLTDQEEGYILNWRWLRNGFWCNPCEVRTGLCS
jgi:hypothetical protein